MKRRRPGPALLAVVLLTALQPVLSYTVGGVRYEFAQLLGLAVLAVALVALARGSRGAWTFLVVLNALPLLAAITVALSANETMATALVVLVATSGPLMVALLSPPMRRHIRAASSQHSAPPAKPLAS